MFDGPLIPLPGSAGIVTVAPARDADVVARWLYVLPATLPLGVFRLAMFAKARAVVGNVRYDVRWALVDTATPTVWATVPLGSEGEQTLTWVAGDDRKTKRQLTTLDLVLLAAGRLMILEVVFKAASTVARESEWMAIVQ